MTMKRHLGKLGWFLAIGVMGLTATTQDAEAKDDKEIAGWRVEGSGTGIVDGQRYSIYNLDQKLYWGYKDRMGANMGWDGTPNNGMMIKRKSGGNAPLKCGEVFALFIEKEWVIYEKQSFGINISSRSKLTNDAWYQWKFTNCTDGETIQLNKSVTLTNTVENDCLVGCKRVAGWNGCWCDDTVSVRGKNYRRADAPR